MTRTTKEQLIEFAGDEPEEPVELKTKDGITFFVDEDVAKTLGHLPWRINLHGYVVRTIHRKKKTTNFLLHREIFPCEPGQFLDHIDGNPLNNTRANLRIATPLQNAKNVNKRANTSSIYKGVSWSKVSQRWMVIIKSDRVKYYLGLFHDEHEAGHEYNKAAVVLHGEFAKLNPVGFGK